MIGRYVLFTLHLLSLFYVFSRLSIEMNLPVSTIDISGGVQIRSVLMNAAIYYGIIDANKNILYDKWTINLLLAVLFF